MRKGTQFLDILHKSISELLFKLIEGYYFLLQFYPLKPLTDLATAVTYEAALFCVAASLVSANLCLAFVNSQPFSHPTTRCQISSN